MFRKLIQARRLVNSRLSGQGCDSKATHHLLESLAISRNHRNVAWFRGRSLLIASVAIVLMHFVLLALAIPDYRVTIDSAYHIAMGRERIEHWPALWDWINYGPRGRPNLQGPLFQIAIGGLGWILGGTGADYVRANAILAVLQWLAAIGGAGVIAYRIKGEWAALFTVSLVTGAAFTSASFAIGIPSGWVFIFTAWAIYGLVRGRGMAAGLFTALAIYCHVGGFAIAPLGMLAAAKFSRRWHELIRAGVIAGVLTAPYALFVLFHLDWFSGERSHSALLFDPMLDLLALAGTIRVFRRSRDYPLLAGWLIAPLPWLPHDAGRFVLQAGLGGGVAAGVMLAAMMERAAYRRRAAISGVALVIAAQVFPLGIPAFAPEIAWDAGLRYPREINWEQAHKLAAEIKAHGMQQRLIADYQSALCDAIAAYQPVACEKGHWIEVQPKVDSADFLSASSKVYVLPIPSDDPVLSSFKAYGWIGIHGGADDDTIVTLAANRPAGAAEAANSQIAREAAWLGANAVNNTVRLGNWRSDEQRRYRAALALQRTHAGRLELAALLDAEALETSAPAEALRMRRAARGFGVIASMLGDEMCIDYLSNQRLTRLRESFAELSAAADSSHVTGSDSALLNATEALLRVTFDGLPKTFAQRPAGDPLPWLGAMK